MRSQGPFAALLLVISLCAADAARAMCGCMLGRRPPQKPSSTEVARAKIVNKASKVALARNGDRTTITMANDFVGAPAEFGLVVPVPSVIKRGDVKVVDASVFDELEQRTSPRLVEVEDPNPCAMPMGPPPPSAPRVMRESAKASAAPKKLKASDYGVKIESHFFAGEYEIAVLSGKDSGGLIAWLQKFDYDVPDDAKEVIGSYIKQNMYFFVARVHVKEMGNGPRFLRPLQVSYTTPKFMLPIRLGMVNADGPQELLVFTMTSRGRVEPTNYRAVKVPVPREDLPAFVKDDFNGFYKAVFDTATNREDMRVVFLEGAARAVEEDSSAPIITRLHFRYDEARFPEDLVLQETGDDTPLITSFTSRKHWLDAAPCDNGRRYHAELPRVLDREAQVLANLTGWDITEVRAKLPRVPRAE